MVVIEMNPRVSRSSALASKATGFPIAKIAAKLAIGYRLHQLPNDITRETKACFEPTIDYVVTKIPRFAFEKFPEADSVLTTQMKSVGETMAIGRTFKESFQKALRGLEVGSFGFGCDGKDLWGTPEQPSLEEVKTKLTQPNEQRVWYLRYAIKYGVSIEEIYELTGIDPWFLENLLEIVEMEERLRGLGPLAAVDDATLRQAKQFGFSDRQLSTILHTTEMDVRRAQAAGDRGHVQGGQHLRRGIRGLHALLLLDLRRRRRDPAPQAGAAAGDDPRRRAQPHRPGHRVRLLLLPRQLRPPRTGHPVDHGQLQPRDRLHRLRHQRPLVLRAADHGRRAQYLRPHPARRRDRAVRRADALEPGAALSNAGVPIIGTSVDTIEDAEDREKFAKVLDRLKLKQPANGIARNMAQARIEVAKIGYPVLVRPSYVLGGRAMEICYDSSQFDRFVAAAFVVAQGQPVLIDRFLEDATEVDVNAIADGQQVIVCGIMEHIEEAGVHSGDSACAIPPYSLPGPVVSEIREATCQLARHMDVRGLMNIQFAVKKEDGRPTVYILEVNPRGSRTVPFVSKATGVPWAKAAAKVMVGVTLAEQGITREPIPAHVSVKEAVFPFVKFTGVDIVLGPEMKSTGEVMGVSDRFSIAFAKSQLAAGTLLPTSGKIFISVAQRNKDHAVGPGGAIGESGLRALGHAGHRGEDRSGRHTRAALAEALARASQRLGLYPQRRPVPGREHAQRQGGADRRGPDSGRSRFARHPVHHHAPGRRRRRPGHGGPAAGRDHRAGRAGPLPGEAVISSSVPSRWSSKNTFTRSGDSISISRSTPARCHSS